ncbi:MAG: hypothetical protein KF749_17745 [Bacteroidetes bacterium]|nr:hypothetical protein [Bacteroidota bacterium]MCW5896333.1 hypothetical protein [Bacteroidota bacterium]
MKATNWAKRRIVSCFPSGSKVPQLFFGDPSLKYHLFRVMFHHYAMNFQQPPI